MRVANHFRLLNAYGPSQKFGMEVELEGDLPLSVDGWDRVNDGSLRDGYEYISPGPKTLRESLIMLTSLDEHIKNSYHSPRCSFHVHVDASFWQVEEAANVIRAYVTMEDFFFQLSGGRDGSQFCCPIHGSSLLQAFKRILRHNMSAGAFPNFEALKYGALNIGHLRDFGSLEFRHHIGLVDGDSGKRWLRILDRFVHEARTIDRDALFSMVKTSPEELVRRLFPDVHEQLSVDVLSILLHFKALDL